jgi:hypothetical protein
MENTKIDTHNLDDCLTWLEQQLGNNSVTSVVKEHAKALVHKNPGALTGEEVMNLAKRQYRRKQIDAAGMYLD